MEPTKAHEEMEKKHRCRLLGGWGTMNMRQKAEKTLAKNELKREAKKEMKEELRNKYEITSS